MPKLPGAQEFLARGLENDTGVEISLTQTLRATTARTHAAIHRLRLRMADGVVTMAEARRTLEEIDGVLDGLEAAMESADISLRYNRIHNQAMCALRAGLDPRGREARDRFPLLRLVDATEGSILRFPAGEAEPEEIVA